MTALENASITRFVGPVRTSGDVGIFQITVAEEKGRWSLGIRVLGDDPYAAKRIMTLLEKVGSIELSWDGEENIVGFMPINYRAEAPEDAEKRLTIAIVDLAAREKVLGAISEEAVKVVERTVLDYGYIPQSCAFKPQTLIESKIRAGFRKNLTPFNSVFEAFVSDERGVAFVTVKVYYYQPDMSLTISRLPFYDQYEFELLICPTSVWWNPGSWGSKRIVVVPKGSREVPVPTSEMLLHI